MLIYGLQKTTLIDYPGNIACTVFTHGCNFRCPFCHNPELVIEDPKKKEIIPEKEFFEFLKKRKKMLDGVVITGGEPLLNKDIFKFIKKIKSLGFAVKVDTNGSFPERLNELLEGRIVDCVAMDIKTSFEEYRHVTGGFVDVKKIKESINILKNSNVEYEFRTTVVKGMHTKKVLKKIGEILKGTETFSLQNFKYGKTVSDVFSKKNEFSKSELEEFKKILEKYISNVTIKNIY